MTPMARKPARTDWFRNIESRPGVAVQIAREWYVPEQRPVPAEEAYAVFSDWMRRQRWFARLMVGQIGESIDVPEAQLRALVDKFPFVAFRPARVRPPSETKQPYGGDSR